MAEALLETEGADQVIGNFHDIASCISHKADTVSPAQTEGAKAAIKELLDSQAEAKAFANAMTATKSSYVPSDRVTNFAQTIDQGTKRLLPVVRYWVLTAIGFQRMRVTISSLQFPCSPHFPCRPHFIECTVLLHAGTHLR